MSKEIIKNDEFKLNPQGYVTLPFNEEDFKEFVVGLLGKPQTIENIIDGAYSIDVSDVKNIYSLLTQRIQQQNEATLIQFNARIIFSDNSSVLLSSIEELLSYQELKPVISTGLHLSLSYLIKFKDKKVSEKQEINISFIASKKDKKYKVATTIDELSPFTLLEKALTTPSKAGYIQYSIKHTARTWGTDIDNLLSGHFESLMFKERKARTFFRENLAFIQFAWLIILGSICTYFIFLVKHNIQLSNQKIIDECFSSANISLSTLSKQIELIIEDKIKKSIDYMGGMILISLTIWMFTSLLIKEIISIQKGSFILLTKKSLELKQIKDKEYEKSWVDFIWTIVLSIISGVISNFIFLHVSK